MLRFMRYQGLRLSSLYVFWSKLRNTKSVTARSACTMSMLAEITSTQGVTSCPWWITSWVVAQIASFSISALQFSMYLPGSNDRRDSISSSMLDWPGRYLMSKLKSASSATKRCPAIVSKQQVITKLLSYRQFEGKELQFSRMHVIVFLRWSWCPRGIT